MSFPNKTVLVVKKQNPKFNYLTGKFNGSLNFQGMAKDAKLNWLASENSEFEILINIYDGCGIDDIDSIVPNDRKALIIKHAKSFALSFGSGMFIFGAKSSNGKIDFPSTDVTPTWNTLRDGKLELNRFVQGNEEISFWTNERSTKAGIYIPLIDIVKKSTIAIQGKTLSISANDKNFNLSFTPKKIDETKNSCTPINISNVAQGVTAFDSKSGAVKIRIEFREAGLREIISFEKKNFLTVKGLNGWYTATGLAAEHTGELISPGIVQGLLIGGNVSYLRLNGQSIENLSENTYSFNNAHIKVEPENDGGIKFNGISNWVWVGDKRLSKTRWEGLDSATQAILISIATFMLAAFGLAFWKCLTRNDELHVIY